MPAIRAFLKRHKKKIAAAAALAAAAAGASYLGGPGNRHPVTHKPQTKLDEAMFELLPPAPSYYPVGSDMHRIHEAYYNPGSKNGPSLFDNGSRGLRAGCMKCKKNCGKRKCRRGRGMWEDAKRQTGAIMQGVMGLTSAVETGKNAYNNMWKGINGSGMQGGGIYDALSWLGDFVVDNTTGGIQQLPPPPSDDPPTSEQQSLITRGVPSTQMNINQGNVVDQTLSTPVFYNAPKLTPMQRRQLMKQQRMANQSSYLR